MSKNKTARTIVSIICVVIILIGVAFAISYRVWTARGDQVIFSPSGNLGLGNEPLSSMNAAGKQIQYGTNHNFLFVRDVAIDRSSFGSFTGGGAPGGGGPGGGGPGGGGGRGGPGGARQPGH